MSSTTPTRYFFFFQAEDGIRDYKVTGVQTCALPIVKQLRDHREDAGEMPRAGCALERVGHGPRVHPHQRLRGVHRRRVRYKETIYAALGGESAIALQVAGVVRQILRGAELERVHEDAQHHAIGPLFRAMLSIFVNPLDRKSTRLNSSHLVISYAV